jgi:NADPH:quinone reductase-like Zn-dependent oxidoreductase
VTGTRHLELVWSVGADEVLDRTPEDFTRRGERYDVILDIAGDRRFSDCRRALTVTACSR